MGFMKSVFGTSLEQDMQNKIAAKYNEQLKQSMLQNIYATNNTGALGQSLLGQNIPYPSQQPQPRRNPNDCEAYVMPLSSLVNLWRAKYGDKWVDVSEIDDEFWSDASARLHKNEMMEESDMNNEPWARLKEGA